MAIIQSHDKRLNEREFTCPQCQWSGGTDDMGHDVFGELTEFSCAKCDKTLVIVPHPTLEQMVAAAETKQKKA